MDRFGPSEFIGLSIPLSYRSGTVLPVGLVRPNNCRSIRPFFVTVPLQWVLQRKQIQSDWWDGIKTLANKVRKEWSWTNPKSRFT